MPHILSVTLIRGYTVVQFLSVLACRVHSHFIELVGSSLGVSILLPALAARE